MGGVRHQGPARSWRPLISLLTTVGIVYALVQETIIFLGAVPIHDFLFGTKWTPLFKPASFGVLPLVAGTFSRR